MHIVDLPLKPTLFGMTLTEIHVAQTWEKDVCRKGSPNADFLKLCLIFNATMMIIPSALAQQMMRNALLTHALATSVNTHENLMEQHVRIEVGIQVHVAMVFATLIFQLQLQPLKDGVHLIGLVRQMEIVAMNRNATWDDAESPTPTNLMEQHA